ncbi:MAG TPA: ABC transporter permease subunit, partial [Burkholderiaceae bacterium]|nr:ABC transporter permease subunit [Burkholderiaceae bacterium]
MSLSQLRVGLGRVVSARQSPFTLLAVLVAALVSAPIVALMAIAATPAAIDSLAHLADTVLPRYALTSALLALQVGFWVIAIGVPSGWMIAAYEFPGKRVLSIGLILPLAMPAFVLAYAYTDLLDVSGPLQSWLRARFDLRVGEYWFPQVRSLPGAGLFLGLALYPYVYVLARNAFAERSESLSEAARSLGLPAPLVWLRVVWPVARPAVVAGATLAMMETLADFGTVSFFAVDTFSFGIYRAWQSFGDRAAAAWLALALLATVLMLIWLERRQRGRMAFHARALRPAPPQRLRGAAALLVFVLCTIPVLAGFVLPSLVLLNSASSSPRAFDPRLLGWVWNTALLSAAAVA